MVFNSTKYSDIYSQSTQYVIFIQSCHRLFLEKARFMYNEQKFFLLIMLSFKQMHVNKDFSKGKIQFEKYSSCKDHMLEISGRIEIQFPENQD